TPRGQHLAFRRRGQRMNVRESLEEKPVVFEHGRDSRLLQHDFRNPDAVRVARFAPREIAAILVVPAQERAAKTARRSILHERLRRNFFHPRKELYGRRHSSSTLAFSDHLGNLSQLRWTEYICEQRRA